MTLIEINRMIAAMRDVDTDGCDKSVVKAVKHNHAVLYREKDLHVRSREAFLERERQRMKLCHRHAKRNPDGSFVMTNGSMTGLEGNPKYEKAVRSMEKYYEKGVRAYKLVEQKEVMKLGLKKIPRRCIKAPSSAIILKVMVEKDVAFGLWPEKEKQC